MSNRPLVEYRRDGEVGVITLARDPINTYDGAFHVRVPGRLAHRQGRRYPRGGDDGHGQALFAGAELRKPLPAPPAANVLPPWDEIRLIKSVMKPTIAAVQGGCIGGGQRMVWPCDLVFCTEDAFFRDPTASMGIGGIQSHIHTWFYGPRLAKEMIYSGMRLPARRLYEQGQVNRLYPDVETLHAETLSFAHEVAKQDPLPLRQAKRASEITMDIQGQHYVTSRMEELLDDFPHMNLRLTD